LAIGCQAAITCLGKDKVITADRSGDVDHIVDITREQSIRESYKNLVTLMWW